MPSTYLSLNYHVVFSTKDRVPSILPEWASRLHEYLGGTINGLGGASMGVGGVADHVHLLFGLKATHCLADVMRELKRSASVWVHEEIRERRFVWPEGYAAFTVGAPSCSRVKAYIKGQEAHHRQLSFREEFVVLLKRAGIEYEDRYLD